MAYSPFRSKATFHHVRSISLPSSSHPLISQFNEHLCRVKASEATSSIIAKLSGLEDLFDCVDDLLLLPHTQQVFEQQRQERWVDEVADGYLKLLDLCGTAKEVFSQTKQDIQELLSMLRRRRDGNDFGGFLASRKKAKKLVIQKSFKDLKSMKNKRSFTALDKDQQTVAIISMLSEVEAVTLDVLESLSCYIVGTKEQPRPNGWSLVSKLMYHTSVTCQDEEKERNEFEKLDAVLHSLVSHKMSKSETENFQNQLGKLESSIQDVEGKVESLFRHLIRTRVSLLNILNH